MRVLRTLPTSLSIGKSEAYVTSRVETYEQLREVIALAAAYRHPHNVLGSTACETYVRSLAGSLTNSNSGWFVSRRDEASAAAVHLSVYGRTPTPGHVLWKLRHPLLRDSHALDVLADLLRKIVERTCARQHESAKFVVFLGEHEEAAIAAVEAAGFRREGALESYYRPGETCFVYGLYRSGTTCEGVCGT